MGNGMSKVVSVRSTVITSRKLTDTEEQQLKVGVVKEEDVIIPTNSTGRDLQNNYTRSPEHWRESFASFNSKPDDFFKVRFLIYCSAQLTTKTIQ